MMRTEKKYIPPFAASLTGFRARKAAQICAYFAVQEGGLIDKLKLIKIVYLAERQFLSENNHPMLFDEFYSLPHGPICSATLNGIDGLGQELWDDFIARSGNKAVSMKNFSRDELDELSDAEYDVLRAIWNKFGKKTASQLRNYSHKNCKEYTEITSGRLPISYSDILEALGESLAAGEIDEEIKDIRKVENILST